MQNTQAWVAHGLHCGANGAVGQIGACWNTFVPLFSFLLLPLGQPLGGKLAKLHS